MSTPNYKTSKRYKCPYCDYRGIRSDIIHHVDKRHEELIPQGYTAARAVYDFINKTDHGTCMICKSPVYEWNDKINRYYNLCKNPACKAKVREIALERHMRVYNKPHLLNDPEMQEKMLANRKISGTYTFKDGTKHTYTGTYEKNTLEFMDKVLEIPGTDIQSPGPVLEYEYEGKIHKWITDIYYIPANLLIEVKDGGSNPNNRSMTSYREKQVAKETMVTNLGKFNYIRLTNNDFSQLLEILADMKEGALTEDDDHRSMKIRINEEVGGLPPHRPPEAYIIPYGANNVFDGFAYGDSESDDIAIVDEDFRPVVVTQEEFENNFTVAPIKLIYNEADTMDKIRAIKEEIGSGKYMRRLQFVEMIVGRPLMCYEQIILSAGFKMYDKERENKINKLLENGIIMQSKEIVTGRDVSEFNVVKRIGAVSVHHTPNGFYASTPNDFSMASEYFPTLIDLERSDIARLMNDVYTNHMKSIKDTTTTNPEEVGDKNA